MKRQKRAVMLTVNGKPAAVVQSVEDYERLLDLAAQEGIRQVLTTWRTSARAPQPT